MCSIEGCSGKILAKGWCRKHYLRWYKHGSPYTILPPNPPKGPESPNYKHGKWNHPLYGIWNHMWERCSNPDSNNYRGYGEKGISVCDRWKDIRNFIQDMGPRPEGTTLDRIDSRGDYEPSNCRWATYTQQGRNRSMVKLSLEKAREIRSIPSFRDGGPTRQEIADDYDVSVATIKKVRSGSYWKEE